MSARRFHSPVAKRKSISLVPALRAAGPPKFTSNTKGDGRVSKYAAHRPYPESSAISSARLAARRKKQRSPLHPVAEQFNNVSSDYINTVADLAEMKLDEAFATLTETLQQSTTTDETGKSVDIVARFEELHALIEKNAASLGCEEVLTSSGGNETQLPLATTLDGLMGNLGRVVALKTEELNQLHAKSKLINQEIVNRYERIAAVVSFDAEPGNQLGSSAITEGHSRSITALRQASDKIIDQALNSVKTQQDDERRRNAIFSDRLTRMLDSLMDVE